MEVEIISAGPGGRICRYIAAGMAFMAFFAFSGPVNAEAEKETTFQSQIPPAVVNEDRRNFLTVTFENDSLGSGLDRDYTSGLRLTWLNLGTDMPRVAREVAERVPTFSINETTSTYYSIGQNLYTPDDITVREHQPDERPWAAFLYGSVGLASITENHIDELETTLGVIGPMAGGRVVQEAVHDALETTDPSGWGNQLENEPGLMVSWRRRWPETVAYDAAGLTFSMEPHIGASLGNVYTLSEGGVSLRLSPQEARWQDLPIRVRPSIPGSGFFHAPESGASWYLFGGLQGRAVARNIFLDGNTFRDSHSVDKKPFVMDANAGLALTFGNMRVSYTLVYRTREFEEQDNESLFGAVSVGYRF